MTITYQTHVHTWLKGHTDACAFINTLFDVAHVLDDLTDRDKPVQTKAVHAAFYAMLIDLPRNPFYVQHFTLLNGTLQTAFLNWQIANALEVKEDDAGKDVAFILRSSYADLVTLCAWIIGGHDWAVQVGQEVRLHASNEGKAQYLASLKNEKRSDMMVGGA